MPASLPSHRAVSHLFFLVLAATAAAAFGAEQPPLLSIQWRLGPDYPMGIQDSAVGVVRGKVVSAGGFTRYPLDIVRRYPDAFGGQPSGFTKLAFAFDPKNESAGWRRIADMPGPARQGAAVAVVDDMLYAMGGINYTEPLCYRETYRMREDGGKWTWEELKACRLPWPVYGAANSTAVIGKRIYLVGAADYFKGPGADGPDFHSEAGRDGSPVGRATLVLDTADLSAGWKRLADLPGVPKFDTALAAVGGKLYQLGGIFAPLAKSDTPYCNAVDSWKYDPAADRWTRLADMPHGSNRRALVYADRWIVLLSGFKYGKTRTVDGALHEVYNAEEKARAFNDFFERTVLVYDTKTDRLGTADPLPERTCYPSAAAIGDVLYAIGGEGGPRLYHPASLQIGKIAAPTASAPGTSLDAVRAKLLSGRPVKIVCLGDSVTGVYYHTGGRRAYPEMIPLAIRGVLPQCSVCVVNAGISGHTTADGLNRLQKDVLDARPDLVTVMFGLNDMVRVPRAEFQANLARIIERCRQVGAEVLLCTPNSVVDTPGRSRAKLADYCEAMREVGRKHSVAVCDVFAAHEAVRSRDPAAWRLLLSDEFHPNMDGHKLHAEEICRAITGRASSLRSAGPPEPAIPKTLSLLAAGKPVRVLAMPPYDRLIEPAIRAAVPSAKVHVTAWPVEGRTLAEIEQVAQKVRAAPPDLVLVAVPAAVTPTAENPPEAAIRAYTWILNWSLSFAQQEWDVMGIAPSALKAAVTADEKSRDRFARGRILAQDLALIARSEGDASPPEKILTDWLRRQCPSKPGGR